MERDGTKRAAAAGRPRWIFQIDHVEDRTVLRVCETSSGSVFREIPIEEYLAYARRHRDVTPWLRATLPGGA
jgi:uncharacterized FlaG/YvyC family protein